MTDICIASFASVEDVAAEQEDPSCELDSMASPQFRSMTDNPTQAWIGGLKEAATGEWEYYYDGEDEDEGNLEDVIWTDEGWVQPEQGRANRTILAHIGEDLIGCIIIQKEILV